jgi:uncharacterized protein with NRDE domain
MCLIVLEWRPDRLASGTSPRLVVAANRDEYYHRASNAAAPWANHVHVLAGTDQGAPPDPSGLFGTWLGVTHGGRFAAITNVRDPNERHPKPTSRGQLVTQFLVGHTPPAEYLLEVQAQGHRYNGFNLLVGTLFGNDPQLWWMSNRGDRAAFKLEAGIFGLSNASLDTPWPKLTKTVARMTIATAAASPNAPRPEVLFEMLSDPAMEHDDCLPSTGVSLPIERMLSAVFIASESYGTRASQVLTVQGDGLIQFHERRFERQSAVNESLTLSENRWEINGAS